MGLVLKNVIEHSSGRCSYRRVFPTKLRPYIPGNKREHKVSLGFRDNPDFLVRCQRAAQEYDTLVDRARRRLKGAFDKLNPERIRRLAETYRVSALESDEQARWSSEERELHRQVAEDLARRSPEAVSNWEGQEKVRWARKTRDTTEGFLSGCRQLRATGDIEGVVEAWADEALDLIEAEGLVADPEDRASLAELCRALNDAAISASQDVLKRLDGEIVETPPAPSIEAVPVVSATRAKHVPLLQTFDAYAVGQDLSPGVRIEWRRYIEKLIGFLGHDDAAGITSKNLRDWRDLLLNEKNDKGLVREPVTVRDKYLTAVRATLNWAVQEEDLDVNPADGIVVRVPKKAQLRGRDFTRDEAKAILAATLRPANPNWSEPRKRAHRWIPWLCAYTGGRVNEFSQLRGQDVYQEEGVWVVRITPEAGSVKTKEARVVPIHEHLIDQGFVAMAQAAGLGPIFYDPERQRVQGSGNRHFKKVGERLAEWVRKDVGITDPAIKPNHGWRHTFKSLTYDAGIEERLADAIQGHAPATTARRYGHASIGAKAEAVAKLPRFILD